MSELSDLYQDVILDHSRKPHNFQVLVGANRKAEGYNPLCGDQITIYLDLQDDVVKDVSFQGQGCAICKSSASIMTDAVKDKTRVDVEALITNFRQLVTQPQDLDLDALGKLAAFSGVSQYPTRVKCAVLAWHTLHSALDAKSGIVSTEKES